LFDRLSSEVRESLGILCSGCCSKELYCGEFYGSLTGVFIKNECEESVLKKIEKLLSDGFSARINKSMLELANETKMECSTCKKFIGWVERPSKSASTRSTEKSSLKSSETADDSVIR
jgi:hypothetical protein